MILVSLIIIVGSILFSLSGLHFYWLSGGDWGLKAVIPEMWMTSTFPEERSVYFQVATLLVALILFSFAFTVLLNLSFYHDLLTISTVKLLTKIIGTVFILRAIGDFKILGLFKKKSSYIFAINDTKYFSPLCLFVGTGCWIISVLG